jgi:hypothetical protein
VEHVLARAKSKAQGPVDQHACERQGRVEDAEGADHERISTRRPAREQEAQDGHAPDHVQDVVARVTGGKRQWQARQSIHDQQESTLEEQQGPNHQSVQSREADAHPAT